MDPVSQGVVGAVAAALVTKDTSDLRFATLVGWTSGMLADADIFIRSADDPLLTLQYHRHFTHSLLFIPVGGLVAAALFWLLFRGRKRFGLLFPFALAGYATSGFLDACTSYGTQLYWPFSEERVAWNIISIIDPVFTGTLLVLATIGIIVVRKQWMLRAGAFALIYLAFGLVQNSRASQVQADLIAERGHAMAADMATVKPSIGNLLLWRSIYRHEGRFHVDAIRVGLTRSPRIYRGESVEALELWDLKDGIPAGSVLSGDLKRFDHFSSSYLARHPDEADVVGDLRYSILPNSIRPLWGIRYDPEQPDRHVAFESFRERDEGTLDCFLEMLSGRKEPDAGDVRASLTASPFHLQRHCHGRIQSQSARSGVGNGLNEPRRGSATGHVPEMGNRSELPDPAFPG